MTYNPNDPNNPNPYVPAGTGYPAPQGATGYPQAQPGMPVPGYVPQPQAQPPAMPQQPVAPQPATPMPMPAVNPVDESMLQDAYTQHKAATTSGGSQFLSFPGPQGQKRWDGTVPVGYESTVVVHIANPWAPGANIFHPTRSHFWKSQTKPQGQSIGCPGPETCLICKAKEAAMMQADEMLRQRAKDAGRVRTRFMYNVFALESPQTHYDVQGVMRPFILQAGMVLHAAIGDIIEARGAMRIVDPQHGRPLRLKKKKTGPRELDVEYSLVDLDPAPLPPDFFPAMQNLWNLSDMDKLPEHASMMTAVLDMGLPIPGSAPTVAPTGPMTPPMPAYANPHAQPVQPAYVPPTPIQTEPPANLAPPPVQSTPTGNQYSPQPSQPTVPVAPPVAPQVVAPGVPTPPPVRQPVVQQAQGRADGRDKCFGKFDGTSNFCKECPPDLQPQCMAQSAPTVEQPKVPQAGQQTVEQLQSQLQGK